MRRGTWGLTFAALMAGGLLLAACGGGGESATPTPGKTSTTVASISTATVQATTATAQPSPTTEVPPNPTSAPVATSTSVPDPTPPAPDTPAVPPTVAGGGETELEMEAQGIAFNTNSITLKAGRTVTLKFKNQDQGTSHNFALYRSKEEFRAGDPAIFASPIKPGKLEETYSFTAPAAGQYHFQCDIHPTQMFGTATVQ